MLAAGIGHGLGGDAIFGSKIATALGHGVAQGAIAEIRGGKFRSGFVGGVVGHVSGYAMGSADQYHGAAAVIGRTTMAAVAGGLTAEATGGSFEDGAFHAAMVHLFNNEAGSKWKNATVEPADPRDIPVLDKLRSLANEARNEIDANCTGTCKLPWVRGTLIHKNFADKVRALGENYYAEISYIEGVVVRYGTPGSVRADAIYGNLGNPQLAVDLKTGFLNYMSRGEAVNYLNNLPAGTNLYPMYTDR